MLPPIEPLKSIINSICEPEPDGISSATGNWNILIGSGFLLLFVGVIVTYLLHKKMGAADERTTQIALKSALIMLCVVILCDIMFPKEYMWQIFFLFKYSFAFLASAIYLAIQYKKDFIN